MFGFKDDVSIRLTRDAGATKVDMRSASRVGLSDLGANAARIEAYFAALKGADTIPKSWIKKTDTAKKILNQK